MFFYVSYAIPLIRPGILNSELELPLRLWVLHSIGGIICSRAGSSSSRAGSSSSRANNSGLYQDPRVQVPEFRQVCSLNESLVPTYKKKSSIFWYTFISHSGNWTPASRVKARCTCQYTILYWLKSRCHMLRYTDIDSSHQGKNRFKFFDKLPQEWMGDIKLGLKVSGKQESFKS